MQTTLKATAAVIVAALIAVACGSSNDTGTPDSTTMPVRVTPVPTLQTPATTASVDESLTGRGCNYADTADMDLEAIAASSRRVMRSMSARELGERSDKMGESEKAAYEVLLITEEVVEEVASSMVVEALANGVELDEAWEMREAMWDEPLGMMVSVRVGLLGVLGGGLTPFEAMDGLCGWYALMSTSESSEPVADLVWQALRVAAWGPLEEDIADLSAQTDDLLRWREAQGN